MPTVYFVCPWFGIFAGGAERATRTLALELHRRGWQVEILTTCSSDLHGDWSLDGFEPGLTSHQGLRVRRFEVNKGRLDRYREIVHDWVTGRDLSESMMYDFFRCGISSQALVDYVGSLPKSDPVVAMPYFHSLTFETIDAHPGRVDLFGCFHDEPQFYWSPVADMLTNARRVIFLAEEEKDLVIQTYGTSHGRRIVEGPNVDMGIELGADARTLLDATDKMKELRGMLGVPDEYFVSVGRKDSGKGLKQILAWHGEFSLQNEEPTPPLVFVGPGPEGAIPESSHIIDLGFVSEEEKFALFSGALCSVNLSTNEAFSLVLMESWLAGTPVVVSGDCPVTAGHCQRSAGGVAVSDRLGFCAALSTFRDPDLRKLVGESGRRYVETRFNWDRVTDRFARALSSSCES